MKVRKDFVTNSSSSSFIVSKNDATKEEMLDIMIELANENYWNWDDDDDFVFTKDDIRYNDDDCICSVSNYYLNEATEEHPYHQWYEFFLDEDWFFNSEDREKAKQEKDKHCTNHWIVDNQSCCRYDWSAVDDILTKHGLYWERGYCD